MTLKTNWVNGDTVTAAYLNGLGTAVNGIDGDVNAIETQVNTNTVDIVASELYARMTVRPTRARRTLIKSLISSLITAGIWPKLDAFYVFAAHNVQAAKLNWVGCAQDITAVNGPPFQIDRGFTGDGATSYLDTNTLANTLEKFVSTNASLGVYNRSATSSNTDVSAAAAAYLAVNQSGNCVYRANGGQSPGGSYFTVSNASNPTGLFCWSRNASDVSLYRAGSLLNSAAVLTNSVQSTNVMFFRDAAGTSWSSHQLAAGFIGQGLSATEVTALNAALLAYLTPIGAN